MSAAVFARRRFATAGALLLAAATVGLFFVSRGKWSDPLIDSGNVWIVPDTLARGELLYRDIIYWFGPFTPYFHAAFFQVFGSGFSTLVVAGALGSLATLAALFLAVCRVAPKAEAVLWIALAVPALVFMPHSGGSILGMGYRIWHGATFALLSVAVLAGPSGRGDRWRPWAAGALAGLAGLCRTEWGIAALLSVLALFLWRGPHPRKAWPGAIAIAAGFLLVFGGVFALFAAVTGWDALLRDAPVLLLNVPSQTRAEVVFAGLRGWQGGLWQMLYSAGLWLGVFFLAEILSVRNVDPGRARRRLPWLAALLALLALSAWAGGLSGPLLLAAAPLVCAAAVVTGLRARREPGAATLLGFGTLGLLLSYRRFFYIGDGPYVAPPLLFAFVCAAGLAAMAAVWEEGLPARQKLRSGLSVVLLLLIGFAFAARFIEYATRETVPIAGTRGLLSARAELAREIAALGETIRHDTRAGDGLVVFPEGEILNFLSRRPNPIRHKLYLPGYVTAENEAEILRELERAAPAAVVVWRRPVGEYGSGLFGEAYGRQIGSWIAEHYAPKPFGVAVPDPRPSFEYYVRRAAAR